MFHPLCDLIANTIGQRGEWQFTDKTPYRFNWIAHSNPNAPVAMMNPDPVIQGETWVHIKFFDKDVERLIMKRRPSHATFQEVIASYLPEQFRSYITDVKQHESWDYTSYARIYYFDIKLTFPDMDQAYHHLKDYEYKKYSQEFDEQLTDLLLED